MLLIGSLAIQHHIPWRKANDVDLVGTYEEWEAYRKSKQDVVACFPISSGKSFYMKQKDGTITECEIVWEGSRAEKLIKFVESQTDNVVTEDGLIVPSLDVLYLLKESHKYLKDSPHFLKTMEDIHSLRKAGAKIRDEHQSFLKEREKDTYTYSHPSLKTSKMDFFDNDRTGVKQIFVHDQVHQAVKRLHKPAYEFFKEDTSEVFCSKELFDKCDEQVKLLSVLEEAMTLAIERSLSVFPGKKTPREAFEMAMIKVCSSIASGWWREYAWNNYTNVFNLYEEDWYDKFLDKVNKGEVAYNT